MVAVVIGGPEVEVYTILMVATKCIQYANYIATYCIFKSILNLRILEQSAELPAVFESDTAVSKAALMCIRNT